MSARHIGNITVTIFVLLLVVSCQQKQAQPLVKHVLSSTDAPAAIGPYSQAIRIGNTLYCSGQIALDPQRSELVDDTIENETRQVLENIGAVLRQAGMDYCDVVRATIYMTLGKAENITIDGKLAPKTRVERPALPIPRLQEMGEDGVLRWRVNAVRLRNHRGDER